MALLHGAGIFTGGMGVDGLLHLRNYCGKRSSLRDVQDLCLFMKSSCTLMPWLVAVGSGMLLYGLF